MPTIIKLPKYEWIDDWVLGDDGFDILKAACAAFKLI
jgi:hypothetical protein